MANRIQYRRDTAANWTAANPVLALGEPGYETDTKRRKTGDGVSSWSNLGYQIDTLTAARLGIVLDKKDRKILKNDGDLTGWTQNTAGGTIATSADTANGAYAGGNLITLTQNTTAQTLSIKSPTFRTPMDRPWFMTVEVDTVNGLQINVKSGASNRVITQSKSDGTFVIAADDGAQLTTVTPASAFTASRSHRITIWCDPRTKLIRYYLQHYTSGSWSTQQFLGQFTTTASLLFCDSIEFSTITAATGASRIARLRIYEMMGVVAGCSLDAGSGGTWDPAPYTARSGNAYDEQANPALLLSQNMNADRDLYVNFARAGFTVQQMYDAYSDFVIALKPRIVFLGSATNTIGAAAALTGTSQTSLLDTAKSQVLSMITQATSIGAAVTVCTVEPRRDGSFAGGANDALITAWNAWVAPAARALGAAVADTNKVLNDGTGTLAAGLGATDNLHLTQAGHATRMREVARATSGGI